MPEANQAADVGHPAETVWGEAGSLALIAIQLGVILALVWAFNLESPAFGRVVLPLAFGGFLIHHWLPRRHQPYFFVGLSLTGIALIFGVVSGAWLVGIGTSLILLCHVPIPGRARVALVVAAASALIALRAAWLPSPVPGVIWPILGSMFMFRLAVYLYDVAHRGASSPGLTLSYFFMLPNTVFLLFPVIDFQTFKRTHYDRPAMDIYAEGVRWMFRGLTHLVLYRLVYQYLTLSPEAVASTADIVRYLVANFALYLRVSGQFHVIVGLLHLFGFRLPETHRFFYVASNFSDMWRRINIYWKDFMQKMVYLPVIFSLKRSGETVSLMAATVAVVAVTWFLHSYQWFWLLGMWLFSATDMVFWGILGVFLIANALREQRRGRVRQLTSQAPTTADIWRYAIQAAGFFGVMAFLWGFWTSPTFGDFLVILRSATLRPIDIAVVLGTFGGVAMVAFVTRRYGLDVPSALVRRPRWQHPLVVSAAPLALFWVAGQPVLAGRVPESVQAIAQQARLVELNKADAERLQRGYYEKIVGVNRYNGQLWEVYAREGSKSDPNDVLFGDIPDGGAGSNLDWIQSDDMLGNALIPLNSVTYKGAAFTTNRWGMRDKAYEKVRPPATQRIVVLGSSYTMGSGVNDGETFEALIEARLNREWSARTGLRYELLNFAVSGYSLDTQVALFESGRVQEFQPNVVLLVGGPSEENGLVRSLLRRFSAGLQLPVHLVTTLETAGVTRTMPEAEALSRLMPIRRDLVDWTLQKIASASLRIGALPVYAIVPLPKFPRQPQAPPMVAAAAKHGFLVIDRRDVYAGHDENRLTLSASDFHPNSEGHQIIADRLYQDLIGMPAGILAPDHQSGVQDKARVVAEWNSKLLGNDGRTQQPQRAGERPATPRRSPEVVAERRLAKAKRTKAKGEAPAGTVRVAPVPPVPIAGWNVEGRAGNAATLQSSRADNWLRVDVTRFSKAAASSISLRHGPIPIVEGHRYVLTFWMKADAGRGVTCGLASAGPAGGRLAGTTDLKAETWWHEATCRFTATRTDPKAVLYLDLGASSAALELSRVELRDLNTGSVVMSTNPGRRAPVSKTPD